MEAVQLCIRGVAKNSKGLGRGEEEQTDVRPETDGREEVSDSDAFIWSYCRPRRPLLRPNLVAVAEAIWKK